MDSSGRDPDIRTAAEVGEGLGLPEYRVKLLAAAGDIAGKRIGRGFWFSWAAVCEQVAGPGVSDPRMLRECAARLRMSAPEVAQRLGLQRATVEGLAAAGEIAGEQVPGGWLFSWPAIYESIAGPGIPDGEIVSLKELARKLGMPERVASYGFEKGTLPGRKVGKKKLFAVEAVRARMAGPALAPAAASVAGQAARRTPG